MAHIDADDAKLDEMSDEDFENTLSSAPVDAHGWAGSCGSADDVG